MIACTHLYHRCVHEHRRRRDAVHSFAADRGLIFHSSVRVLYCDDREDKTQSASEPLPLIHIQSVLGSTVNTTRAQSQSGAFRRRVSLLPRTCSGPDLTAEGRPLHVSVLPDWKRSNAEPLTFKVTLWLLAPLQARLPPCV